MARVNLEQFKDRVEKGKPIPALLLLGDEPYLRDACRASLIQKFVPEVRPYLGGLAFFRGSRRNAGGARPMPDACRCFPRSKSCSSKMPKPSKS